MQANLFENAPKRLKVTPQKKGFRDFFKKSGHWLCLEMVKSKNANSPLIFCENHMPGKIIVLTLWTKIVLVNYL